MDQTVVKPPEMRMARVQLLRWKDVSEAARGKVQPSTLPACLPESKTTLWQRADSCGEHELRAAPSSIFLRGAVT